MKTLLEFDYKKATQAINYLAKKEGGEIDKMKVIKLIYFADRYHLRKYGRPIVNDNYLAMPYGAVGSAVKDIAGSSSFLAEEEREYASGFISSNQQANALKSISEPDIEVFSESDIEALDFAFKEFGNLNQFELARLTHEYPEWKKFESPLTSKETTRENMNYADFFTDPISMQGDKFIAPKEEVEASKEIFDENYRIAAFWN